MKINPKTEKGSITMIVLVAMLFLIALLMSIYVRIGNKAKTSAETTNEIAKRYNNIDEANDIYNNYFSHEEIIPIYNREQLEKIGSGEQITINGKIYTYAPDAIYTIQNDLDLGGAYNETTKTWNSDEPWEPLPSTFTGILDGLGHTITGLYINEETATNQGFFGTLEGTVKNLKLVNGYIRGQSNIGVFAGSNNGTIENCQGKGVILALSSDNGKVQVDGIWYNSLEDYINGTPVTIEMATP